MRMRTSRSGLALALVAVLAAAAPVPAQVFTGRIEVTAVDATGAVLPGVAVELTGTRNATLATDAGGVARFLNLEPGSYQVKASLAGFSDYLNKEVPVGAGGTVPLKVTLRVAGVHESVEVAAETPVIDARKSGTSTNVTLDELRNIPSARDPWVVMQTVPGVIVDRVNVGGSESGQQSTYQAKGASGADATWNLDGIPITDMAATGSTPTYYDFDMFQEMNVTTGGSDMGSSTGGVHLNLVLKSGTSTPHGSARVYLEDQSMQGNNMSANLATALGSPNGRGNRTSRYADYGFEVGGPIMKNRLWGWGSIGRTDVQVLTITQAPVRTILENRALKVQAQATRNIRAGFTYFHDNKLMYGRDASIARPPETTYNQKGPSSFYKGEVNFVVGHDLFLSARGSHLPTGFSLDPQGGMDKQVWQDDRGVWHGSYWNYVSDRPQDAMMGEGSCFRGRHEVEFGFSWRRVTVDSTSAVAGNKIVTYYNGYPDMLAYATSDWASSARATYSAAWIGDTWTGDRFTLNAGVRFDWQSDGTLAVSEAGVPAFSQYLPPISSSPVPDAVTWNSASPRLNLSYALNESRKTLLRASYARFASQLPNGISSQISTVQYRYIAFGAVDTNGNGIADVSEIDQSVVEAWSGLDLNHPGRLQSINTIGDYKVPATQELIAGIDHELFPNFGLSGAFTWRRMQSFNWSPRIGVTRADYVQAGTVSGSGLPDGSSYHVPYYAIDPSLVANIDAAQGTVYTSRDGYHQRFIGFEASATRRLANRWMARLGFSSNTHQEFFSDPDKGIVDPTPGPSTPYVDGGLVITQASGSGKSGIYLVLPTYQLTANGLYQAAWGVDLGVNLVMRQGFGQPWYQSRVSTGDYFNNRKDVALFTDIGQNRLPAVTSLDVRVGKAIKVKRASVNIDLDIFNLFNAGTVLGRQYDKRLTGATGFNQVLEIMNPRLMRVGLRMSF